MSERFNPNAGFFSKRLAEEYLQKHGFVYDAAHRCYINSNDAYMSSERFGVIGRINVWLKHLTKDELDYRARLWSSRKHHHTQRQDDEYSCSPLESLLYKL
jgi:hypothetical protein